MKMVRTVSLRPDLPKGRFLPMLETCVEIFDEHTKWATENRTYNKQKAHEALYRNIRESHPEIPSAILQTTRDCALEASKRCNKGSNGEWKTPRKNTLSVRYNLRTLSVRGNLLTLSCIGRRFRIMLDCDARGFSQPDDTLVLRIPEHFQKVVQNWRCKAATLKYDRRGGFRLNLNYEMEAPPKITGSRDVCHVVSRSIADTSGVSVFALEDLHGIRNKRRGRRLNREISSWPFHVFLFCLTYKAMALGKTVVTVPPAYTSQRCFKCGHTESRNRQGSRFLCRMCGVCCHSDTNAAKNILFVHEADAKLHASVPCSPTSRRKAPGGQVAVNQPKCRTCYTPIACDISSITMRQALSLAANHQPCAGGN